MTKYCVLRKKNCDEMLEICFLSKKKFFFQNNQNCNVSNDDENSLTLSFQICTSNFQYYCSVWNELRCDIWDQSNILAYINASMMMVWWWWRRLCADAHFIIITPDTPSMFRNVVDNYDYTMHDTWMRQTFWSLIAFVRLLSSVSFFIAFNISLSLSPSP